MPELAGATVKAVYVNDTNTDFTADGLAVAVSADTLNIGDNKIVVAFETADSQIEVSLSVIKATMIITTVDEWKNLSTTMTVDNLIEHDKSYGGYYILGADIDMAGATFGCLWNWTETRTWNSRSGGFMGTIDGRGHYVANMKTGPFGLFGIMNTVGVLKNIGFLNLDLSSAGSLLGSMSNGTVENVYVDLVAARRGANPNGFGLGNPNGDAYGEYNWKNSFINVQSVTADHKDSVAGFGYVLGSAHNGFGAFTNVLMVSNGANVYNALSTGNPAYGAGELNVYQTKADMMAAEDWSIEGWSDIWALDGQGLPIFKSIKDSALYDVVITNTVLEVVQGGEYQVNVANPANVVYSVANEGFEISASGKITVPADTEVGTKIVVTATNLVSGDSASIEIVVTESVQTIRLDSIGYVGIKNGETFNVNLADYANYTLVSAICDGANAFTTASFAEGVLTLDTATLGTVMNADKMLNIKLTSDEGTVVLEIPFKTATMTIGSTEDLNAFSSTTVAQNDYFVVTNSFDYTGEYTSSMNFKYATLDGQGYTINNLHVTNGFIRNSENVRNQAFVKNLIFTNAKANAGNAFLFAAGGFTMNNIYISMAADNQGYALNLDTYGVSQLNGVIVEFTSGKGTEYASKMIHPDYGTLKNIYVVGGVGVVQGFSQWHGNDTDEAYAQYNSWNAFRDANIDFAARWDANFWDWSKGVAVPKNLTIKSVPNVDAMGDTVVTGGVYDIPFVSGHIASINEVAGVSLSGSSIVVSTEVADETEIVITFTNVVTGDTTTKTIKAISSRNVTLETTTDIDVNTANEIDVSEAGLVSVSSVTANGTAVEVAFADGKVTLPANVFGNGKTDWENQTFTVLGKDADGANVTVTVPVFAYAAVSDIRDMSLKAAGYVEDKNYYGYFRLTSDFDATGWTGNGTYSGGWTHFFYGTIDGQGHMISNFAPQWASGVFCCNYGTIKNLIFKNVQVNNNTSVIAMDQANVGVTENIVVEVALNSKGDGGNPVGGLVSKNNSGIIRNNVVIYTGGYSNTDGYQGLFAAWSKADGTVENNVAVKLVNNTIYGVPGTASTITSDATECANETNKIYDSAEAYLADAGNITQDDWAMAYMAKLTGEYVNVVGSAAVAVGASGQYGVISNRYGATFSLKEAVEGVSMSADGVLTVGADVTAENVTVVATNALGVSREMNVAIVSKTESVSLAAVEYDAYRNAGAAIDVSSVSTEDLALLSVTVGGSAVEATMADGVVTIANDKLVLGPTANNVVISVVGGTTVYEVSVSVTKVTMIIKTADDLDNWNKAAYAADAEVGYWGGYIVLGNDIDYTGHSYAPFNTWSSVNALVSGATGFNSGFRGIFDGRGHIIDNFTMHAWAGGFIGYTIANCTVKNISFTNAKLSGGTALLGGAGGSRGQFENIYVQMTLSNGNPANNDKTGVIPDMYGAGNVNNCYFDITMTEEANAGVKGMFAHKGFANLTGVYMTGVNPAYGYVQCTCCGEAGLNVAQAYADRAAMIAATDWQAEVATWDTSFWATDSDGLPIPKTVWEKQTGEFDGEWVTL